jgi:hypothetical protein
MDVRTVLSKIGISNNHALQIKAEELDRLASMRCRSSLGNLKIAQAALCIELAAKQLQVAVDRKAVIKAIGVPAGKYNTAFVSLKTILGVQDRITLDELCTEFRLTSLLTFTKGLLADYEQAVRNRIGDERKRREADFSSPVYAASALAIAALLHDAALDTRRLLSFAEVSRGNFMAVKSEFEELLPRVKTALAGKSKSSSSNKSSGSKLASSLSDDDAIPVSAVRTDAEIMVELAATTATALEGNSKGNATGGKNAKSAEDEDVDFDEWSRRILEAGGDEEEDENEAEEEKQQSAKRRRLQ